ncbi:hypothetical protein BOTBODRAFT_30221 [Botryobasidium botryosum FD-172 SS1]|uniref:Uncharacterized protein n=1 Tax=Botryobasidium botryosum (strain FD-172 SS1) TaxID=930990 RepID=A0A067N0Y2_BOTB1|nr:hypothetical protein BOTBODRAFT_30221 [Botryobasidium botryosum FD-172 SS1]
MDVDWVESYSEDVEMRDMEYGYEVDADGDVIMVDSFFPAGWSEEAPMDVDGGTVNPGMLDLFGEVGMEAASWTIVRGAPGFTGVIWQYRCAAKIG